MQTAVLNKPKSRGQTASRARLKVIACANMESIEGFAGRTVGEVETLLRDVINPAPDARAEVDSQPVDRDRVLTVDDEVLEFVRPAGVGEKG